MSKQMKTVGCPNCYYAMEIIGDEICDNCGEIVFYPNPDSDLYWTRIGITLFLSLCSGTAVFCAVTLFLAW